MIGYKIMEEVYEIWHQDTTRDFTVFIYDFMKRQENCQIDHKPGFE